jgi:hypothetical protein
MPVAPAPRSPLAVVALVLAVVACVLSIAAGPVQLVLQLSTGILAAGLVLGFGLPLIVLAVVALVLGIVSARGRRPRAIEGAAIGLAAFLVIGQLGSLISLLVAYAL